MQKRFYRKKIYRPYREIGKVFIVDGVPVWKSWKVYVRPVQKPKKVKRVASSQPEPVYSFPYPND